ncbi:MAG TPA: hypothetical protein VGF79_12645 [Bacteroidia bacterium]
MISKLCGSSLAPYFASNGMAMYNFNPAYFGQMNSKNTRFEFNVQTSYAANFRMNKRGFDYWDYPVFYKFGSYGCIGFDQTNFRQNYNVQTYSFNGLKVLKSSYNASVLKEWRLGYGGSFNVENVDQSVNGRHVNVGLSIARKGKFGTMSFGFSGKLDNYKGSDITFEGDHYNNPPIRINERVFNFDFGIRYSNRSEKFNLGLAYYNLKSLYITHENDHGDGWTGGYNQTLVMPYYHYVLFNLEQIMAINSKMYLKHALNIPICQIRSNLSYEYIRVNTALYKTLKNKNELGVGLTILPPLHRMDQIVVGPSLHYQSKKLKFQYTLQINNVSGFKPLPSMKNELAISFLL